MNTDSKVKKIYVKKFFDTSNNFLLNNLIDKKEFKQVNIKDHTQKYNKDGKLIELADNKGSTMKLGHYKSGELKFKKFFNIINPEQNQIIKYYKNGKVKYTKDTKTWSKNKYDKNNNLIFTKDSQGRETICYYDSHNNITRKKIFKDKKVISNIFYENLYLIKH